MMVHTENSSKLRALKLSAFAIASVVLVEVTLGSVVNSLAIISDGLHALLDLTTTVMLFIAAKAALEPPDEEHLYGHEKFEAIGGLAGGIILLGVAAIILYEAITKFVQGAGVNQSLSLAGFAAIGFTFCIDIFRLAIFRSARGDSSTIKVGLYHALADLSSTVIAFVGFGLAVLVGINWGDSVASFALSVFLGYLSVGLIRNCIRELSDSASKETIMKTQQEISRETGVAKIENLRARKVGTKYFIETSVQVKEGMSLDQAHYLASKIEANLARAFGNVDATIHIEPNRKGAPMEQLVEKLAEVEGVREVHDIATVYASGKLYITLHAIVDPALSVVEAHNIAEEIEERVHYGIKQLEHVMVHVEPYDGGVKSIEINEDDLNSMITKATDGLSQKLRVTKILTYIAAGKRYINLTCCFTKKTTIAEAHKLAFGIEKEIKERYADTTITIHMEPLVM